MSFLHRYRGIFLAILLTSCLGMTTFTGFVLWRYWRVQTLIGELKNDNASKREGAAEQLGKFGPAARKAVPALTDALSDSLAGLRGTLEWCREHPDVDMSVWWMTPGPLEAYAAALSEIDPDAARMQVPILVQTVEDKALSICHDDAWNALRRIDQASGHRYVAPRVSAELRHLLNDSEYSRRASVVGE
jgi:hypothetical protein